MTTPNDRKTSSSNFQSAARPYLPRNVHRCAKTNSPSSASDHPGSRPLHLHPQWKSFLKLLGAKLSMTPAEHRPPFLELLKEADLL